MILSKRFKQTAAWMLVVSVVLSCVPFAAADLAQKEYTFEDFKLSESAAQAGCTISGDESGGIILSKRDRNDNHATSEVWMDEFVFSADVEILDGSNPILTFGVKNRDDVPSGEWYAICPNRNTESPAYSARIFKVSGGALQLNEYVPMTDEQLEKTAYNMKVSVDGDKNIKFYIDDQLILACRDLSYTGGYLGLLSWDAQVRFSNIKIEEYDTQTSSEFNTNLTGLAKAGNNGSWMITSDGFTGQGTGDSFALSDSAPDNFIYEADVKIESGDAASLVFRSNYNGGNAYVANVDLGDFSNARIFKFTDSGAVTLGEYKITDKSVKDYSMRVEVNGSDIRYFLNGRLIISCSDYEFTSGRLGLLVCNSTSVFNNVLYTDLSDDLPVVDSLAVSGAQISPEYSTSSKLYSAAVNNLTDSITLTLETKTEASVYGYNKSTGLDILDSAVYTEPMTIALGEGENIILVRPGNGETVVIKIKRRQSDDIYYNEPYRPQFHITPESGWLNDPNGLVYYEGEYHVFYQYYPDSKYSQDIKYWAHMVSTDLVHWTELPIALAPDEYGSMWSGSCVADLNNTSGLFSDTEEKSGLVIYYTCTDPKGLVQRQCMAYSKDKGRTWIKYNGGAPILDADDDPLNDSAFRDPKVFWHEESAQWMMICAGGPVRFYSSDNLIDWKAEGMQPELVTECADFYKMTAAGTDTEKWVLSGGGVWYMVGDFKLVGGVWKFVPDSGERLAFNSASDTYAGITFNNAPDNRRIMMSWMVDLGYSNQTGDVTDPYNGALTVPYELTLVFDSGKYRINQEPIGELESLRGSSVVLDGITVDEETVNPLRGTMQETFEIDAVISENQAEEFGFILRAGGGKQTVVKYDSKKEKLILDRRNSGESPTSGFLTSFSETVYKQNGKLSLKILVDRSSAELFANGKAFTSLIFPESSGVGMELYSKNGAVTFETLRIYKLNSIFRAEQSADTAKKITVSSGKTKYAVSEKFTVFAVPDSFGAQVHAKWSVSDDGVLQIIEEGSNYAVVKAVAQGEASVIATDGDLRGEWKILAEERVFNTNLSDLEAVGGSWEITSDGLEGSGVGNSPILSQSFAADFSYEADMRYIDGNVGAALIFRAADDLSVYYTADVCERDRRARILKFTMNPVTGSYSDVTLGNAGTLKLTDDHRYNLKVLCVGSKIEFYVNGELLASANDGTSLSGRFGLNVCDITGAFQNVYYELLQSQDSDDANSDDSEPDSSNSSGTSTGNPILDGVVLVDGNMRFYKNGKAVGGSRLITYNGKQYVLKKGVVLRAGQKWRKVTLGAKSYIINRKGEIQKAVKYKYRAINVGKATYVVNARGVIQKSKNKKYAIVAASGKRYIINKKGRVQISGNRKYRVIKVKSVFYIVNKRGIVRTSGKKVSLKLRVKSVVYKVNKRGAARKIA